MTGLRETARLVGVDHAYLARLAKQGRVPRNANKSFDVEAVRKAITSSTDPALVRPKRGDKQPVTESQSPSAAVTIFECLSAFDPADRKAVALGLIIAHQIGASVSNLALSAGASIKSAFALRDLASLSFMLDLEDALVRLGIEPGAIRYHPELMDDLDWSARARDVGDTFNLKACKSWAAECARRLEATPEQQ